MCDPIQEVGNALGSVGDAISGAVGGISDALSNFEDTVRQTAEQILRDPLPTILTVGLTYIGVPPAISQAIVTASQGGNLEDIALSAAKVYVAGKAGEYAGSQYSSAANLSANELLVKNIITSSSSSAALVALNKGSFKDVLAAGVSTAVGSYINDGLKKGGYSGYTTEVVTNASRVATTAILKGKDIGQAIGQSIASTTISYGIKKGINDIQKNTELGKTITQKYNSLIKEANTWMVGANAKLQSELKYEYDQMATAYNNINPDYPTGLQSRINRYENMVDDYEEEKYKLLDKRNSDYDRLYGNKIENYEEQLADIAEKNEIQAEKVGKLVIDYQGQLEKDQTDITAKISAKAVAEAEETLETNAKSQGFDSYAEMVEDKEISPIREQIVTEYRDLSDKGKQDYVDLINGGMDPTNARAFAAAFDTQYARYSDAENYAAVSDVNRDLLGKVEPGSPTFFKDFNKVVENEIALGGQGYMVPLKDGTYLNQGVLFFKDKNGNWDNKDLNNTELKTAVMKVDRDRYEGFKVDVSGFGPDITGGGNETGGGNQTSGGNETGGDGAIVKQKVEPNFFDKYGLFSTGTSNPLAEKVSIFGTGASFNEGTDNGFSIFATDGEKKQTIIWLEDKIKLLESDPSVTERDFEKVWTIRQNIEDTPVVTQKDADKKYQAERDAAFKEFEKQKAAEKIAADKGGAEKNNAELKSLGQNAANAANTVNTYSRVARDADDAKNYLETQNANIQKAQAEVDRYINNNNNQGSYAWYSAVDALNEAKRRQNDAQAEYNERKARADKQKPLYDKALADKVAADKLLADKQKAIADQTKADAAAKILADKAAKAANEKILADKLAADKAAAVKNAATKAAAETAAAEKAKADKVAADKAAAAKVASDKVAAAKVAADKNAADKAAEDKIKSDAAVKVAAEKAAASKAKADQVAADKAASQKAKEGAAAKAVADKAEHERLKVEAAKVAAAQKLAAENAKKEVDAKTKTEKEAAAKVKADQVAADKEAAVQANADKVAADKAAAAKVAADKAAAAQAVADKNAADKAAKAAATTDAKAKAAAEKEAKAAADKALLAKIATEKAAAAQAAADKASADKAAAAQVRAEKAVADKAVADKAKADKAIADQIAAEKAAADKVIADKLKADQAAAAQIAADKVAADKAVADKLKADQAAAAQIAADKVAAEKKAADKATYDKGVADRAAAAQAAKEKAAADKAAAAEKAAADKAALDKAVREGRYYIDPTTGKPVIDDTLDTVVVKPEPDDEEEDNTLDPVIVKPRPDDEEEIGTKKPTTTDPTKPPVVKPPIVKPPVVPPVVKPPITPSTYTPRSGAPTSPLSFVDTPLDTSPQFLSSQYYKEKPVLKGLEQLYGDLVPPLAGAAVQNMAPDKNEERIESSEEDMSEYEQQMAMANPNPDPDEFLQQAYGVKFMKKGGSEKDTEFSLDPPDQPDIKHGYLTSSQTQQPESRMGALRHLYAGISNRNSTGILMAKGGLPSKYAKVAPKGHKPEFITGVTGYYAGGRGTGQSDDIPAMLHEGDYVIDADAVAALGDGSSKAGNEALMKFMSQVPFRKGVHGNPVPAKIADGEVVLPAAFVTALGRGDNKRGAKILDGMREELREHKRSAPTSKIPPKAKSPLSYLKMGSKG